MVRLIVVRVEAQQVLKPGDVLQHDGPSTLVTDDRGMILFRTDIMISAAAVR